MRPKILNSVICYKLVLEELYSSLHANILMNSK